MNVKGPSWNIEVNKEPVFVRIGINSNFSKGSAGQDTYAKKY